MVDRIKSPKATARNYKRFAAVASVRGEGDLVPLGIPDDISESGRLFVNQLGTDGHSHSYMPLRQAFDIFKQTEELPLNKDYADFYLSDYFQIEEDGNLDINAMRIVFYFDD